MLQRLHIENYALIDQLDLSFSNGLSVITGETGAGKSILLGALSLVLGQRADGKVIQIGRDKCITEAHFDLTNYNLEHFFLENDLEYDPEICIIRRELYSNGKSRAFVNDSPVALNILKELSSKLMDIHSQHQNLLLGSNDYQLSIVDALTGENDLFKQYVDAFTQMSQLQSELKRLETVTKKAREEEEFLRFQFEQLESANLKLEEQEALEEEEKLLTHSEEIKLGLQNLVQLLDMENGIVSTLKLALNQAESTLKVYSGLEDSTERIRTSYVDMHDLSRDIEMLFNNVEVNPTRMEQVTERLNQLFSLQQKHKVKSTHELIELRDAFAQKLELIDSSDDSIEKIKTALADAVKQTTTLAEALTKARKKVLPVIETSLVSTLQKLGMPKVSMKMDWKQTPLEPNGQDEFSLRFSANGHQALQPIDKVASGGELSRIMLCIKALIAEHTFLPTLLFDEIDTGVSGEIAHKMGEIMKVIAQRRQVICITHLPQIAVKGKAHFKVQKVESNGKTITTVRMLNTDERLTEIASMLSGANLSEAAMQNAQQLLFENK